MDIEPVPDLPDEDRDPNTLIDAIELVMRPGDWPGARTEQVPEESDSDEPEPQPGGGWISGPCISGAES